MRRKKGTRYNRKRGRRHKGEVFECDRKRTLLLKMSMGGIEHFMGEGGREEKRKERCQMGKKGERKIKVAKYEGVNQ